MLFNKYCVTQRLMTQQLIIQNISSINYDNDQCNSLNHSEYSPFWMFQPGVVTVEKTFYDRFNIVDLDVGVNIATTSCIKKPHQKAQHNLQYKWYWTIYHHVVLQYSANPLSGWVPLINEPNYHFVKLSHYDLTTLKEIMRIRAITGKSLTQSQVDNFTKSFLSNVKGAVTQCGHQAFVKLSNKSSKNDGVLSMCTNVFDIINNITSSREILKTMLPGVDEYLLIKPWVVFDKLNDEYRVIIINSRIKAISQQQWSKQRTKCCGKVSDKVFQPIVKTIEYVDLTNPLLQNCIMDVYIKNGVAHIIEVNPPGLWCASGSALFHWINDYDILFGDCDMVYVRMRNHIK